MDAVRLDNDEGKGRGDLLTREEIARQLRKKKNHTLSVMVCIHSCFSSLWIMSDLDNLVLTANRIIRALKAVF